MKRSWDLGKISTFSRKDETCLVIINELCHMDPCLDALSIFVASICYGPAYNRHAALHYFLGIQARFAFEEASSAAASIWHVAIWRCVEIWIQYPSNIRLKGDVSQGQYLQHRNHEIQIISISIWKSTNYYIQNGSRSFGNEVTSISSAS